jgi:hypothetical protein
MPNGENFNITPNDAFKEKNHHTIYDINYEEHQIKILKYEYYKRKTNFKKGQNQDI